MCQGEETWKGNKMTVSVSVKSWHRLERRIQTSTEHGRPQRASGNADFLRGKSQLLCLGLASCPRANGSCKFAGGVGKAGHGNTHHTPTENRVFWCSIHPHPPPPAPSL